MSLYLEQIELSNFRVYGDSFTLSLPKGPGVTLISGPNGMGKTTFFDGIEWCLTGNVSRFEEYMSVARRRRPDHLTRFGAPEDSHRVSLSFSEGPPIDRGLGFEWEPEAVARFLKQPEWPEIGDLYLYLSLTHFLGQSATQRFSLKKPKEQWEALKGPAGIDRINYLKDRIGGQGTRQAFTRATKAAKERFEQAEVDLLAWRQLISERDRDQQISVSSEAVDPPTIRSISKILVQDLGQLNSRTNLSFDPSSPPESLLEEVSTILVEASKRIQAREGVLTGISNVPERLARCRAELATVAKLSETISQKTGDATSAIAKATELLADQTASLLRARRKVTEATLRVSTLSRIATATSAVTIALQKLDAIDKEIAQAHELEQKALSRRAVLVTNLAVIRSRTEERERLAKALFLNQERLKKAKELETTTTSLNRHLADGDPRPLLSPLKTELNAAVDRERQLVESITRVNTQLNEIDTRARAINVAVASIASQLSELDLDCPVCSSHFERGQLRVLAAATRPGVTSGAQELAVTLASASIELATIRKDIARIGQSSSDLQTRIDQIGVAERVIRAIRADLDVPSASSPSEIISGCERLILQQTETLESLEKQIGETEAIALMEDEIASVSASANAAAARRQSQSQLHGELEGELESARALLQQHPDLWSLETGILTPLEPLKQAAASATVAAGEAVMALEANVTECESLLASHRKTLAEATEEHEAYGRKQADLLRQQRDFQSAWVAAGFIGEPDSAAFDAEQDKVIKMLSHLAELRSRHEQLVNGYRKWLQDQELSRRQSSIQERLLLHNLESEDALTQRLLESVGLASEHLANTEKTRAQVDAMVVQLQTDADKYAEQVLQPLTATIQRFGCALMTRADESIFYKAEHHANRSELKPGIVRRDHSGAELAMDMNPNLFFSEGQLSALSVSALLAASTTFRWSRWKALLMDDPLQHNDVIHSSAFVDILRSLVVRLGYQVIVSTHDAAEASFIARKCESAGIPLKLCELQVRSGEGLVSL
jgi:DNA repair exonuclease SbcCD ATPase subunit